MESWAREEVREKQKIEREDESEEAKKKKEKEGRVLISDTTWDYYKGVNTRAKEKISYQTHNL